VCRFRPGESERSITLRIMAAFSCFLLLGVTHLAQVMHVRSVAEERAEPVGLQCMAIAASSILRCRSPPWPS